MMIIFYRKIDQKLHQVSLSFQQNYSFTVHFMSYIYGEAFLQKYLTAKSSFLKKGSTIDV